MNCRFCETLLTLSMADLNASPPSNSYLSSEDLVKPESNYPLKVWVCESCWLAQVDEFKKHDEIFDENYAYFSSYANSWLEHCSSYVDKVTSRLGLDSASFVIELASNDGYLLQYFLKKGIPCLGIEPTASTAAEARKKGIETVEEFFTEKLGLLLKSKGKEADLIIGNNVLAHVPNISDFVGGLHYVLKSTGTVTMEFPHLLRLLQQNQFDTIYHEHFSYLSLYSVSQIFSANKLKIYDVDKLSTHGGSLRIYACQKENNLLSVSNKVKEVLALEEQAGLRDKSIYLGFQDNVDRIKQEFIEFLLEQRDLNKKVAAYGAAAKGNTLLNYCGIKSDLIEYVSDASPYKCGQFMPGSHIPIVEEVRIQETKPDYIVILPWNIEDEIVAQLSYVRDWGCKFVTAIPRLKII